MCSGAALLLVHYYRAHSLTANHGVEFRWRTRSELVGFSLRRVSDMVNVKKYVYGWFETLRNSVFVLLCFSQMLIDGHNFSGGKNTKDFSCL